MQIQVLTPDGAAHVTQVTSMEVTVGRGPSNTIILEDPKISTRHLQISFVGNDVFVRDLNSTNGTLIGRDRLLPNQLTLWPLDQALQIGSYYLSLDESDSATGTNVETGLPGAPLSAALPGMQTMASGTSRIVDSRDEEWGDSEFGLLLPMQEVMVEPGQKATLPVGVQRREADTIELSLEGIPAEWLETPRPIVQADPKSRSEVSFTINPPRSPETLAQSYPLIVRAVSTQNPQRQAQQNANLTVTPFEEFDVTLSPIHLTSGESLEVLVENEGNSEQTYKLKWEPSSTGMAMMPLQEQVTIASGQQASTIFASPAGERPFIGSRKRDAANLTVTAPQGESRSAAATIITRPIIPLWLIFPLALIALGVAGLFAYDRIEELVGITTPEATPEPLDSVVSAELSPTPVANQNPSAQDDNVTTTVNKGILISVLNNDTDADGGDVLTITFIEPPSSGNATIVDSKAISYTPNTDFADIDVFGYTVSDGKGGEDTALITINISPLPNQPPTAKDDAATTVEGTGVEIKITENDTDPENDTLAVTITIDPINGTAEVTNSNTITYTPKAGFAGKDTLSYEVDDGKGGKATAKVEISITENKAPKAEFTASPEKGVAPLTVNFDGSASSDPDDDDAALKFEWSFGDGETGAGIKVTHEYANAGIYQVKVTVKDTSGKSTESELKKVEVFAPNSETATANAQTAVVGTATAEAEAATAVAATATAVAVTATVSSETAVAQTATAQTAAALTATDIAETVVAQTATAAVTATAEAQTATAVAGTATLVVDALTAQAQTAVANTATAEFEATSTMETASAQTATAQETAVAMTATAAITATVETATAEAARIQTAIAQTVIAQTAIAQTATAEAVAAQTATAEAAIIQTAVAQTATAEATAAAQTAIAQTATAEAVAAQTATAEATETQDISGE